jgi:hypothetical protein
MKYLPAHTRIQLMILIIIQSTGVFSQADTTFHIYLMFGQSNMEGQGIIEAQDRVTNPRVKMLQDSTCPNLNRVYGKWYTAAPPLNRCWGRLGPGDSFGRELGEKAPSYVKTIGLLNVSVSGCNIYIYKKGCPDGLDQYSKGIPFNCGYTWLLDLAKKAQQAGVIKGIIFHQGETNTSDPDWKYTVQQIVADLKTDLGLGDIPFLAGELLYAQYNSCCSAHNIEINKLPALITNAHVISAAGLPGVDGAHFTSASYRTLGERYAQKMLKLVYNICDSTTIESWCQINGSAWTQSSHIKVLKGAKLVLDPRPSNSIGSWNWTGAGTSGSKREQTVNTSNVMTDTAMVTFTNDFGIQSHLSIVIEILDPATGIKSGISKDNSICIYPNPADNAITIKGFDESGTIDFKNGLISNMYGQALLTIEFAPSTHDNLIDISQLAAGTYFLTLISSKGTAINKFVKLK